MNNDGMRLHFLDSFIKRCFDIFFSLVGLLLLWWVIILSALISWATLGGESGFFLQKRVGRQGKIFSVIKIRTMRSSCAITTTVTTLNDSRITPVGHFFRRSKIDELPQLVNVLLGQMSLVGPRPDVPGFADTLVGKERAYLSLRPGVTGPASIKYQDEEKILANVDDPEKFNRDMIFPDKVQINLEYIRNYSIMNDIKYIVKTIGFWG